MKFCSNSIHICGNGARKAAYFGPRITSYKSHCNKALTATPHISAASFLQALQSVLNSAVRLIMWQRRYDRIIATLRRYISTLAAYQAANNVRTGTQLVYKLCAIAYIAYIYMYKCVRGAAPSYLAEMCIPVAANSGRRFLRSASHGDLMVHVHVYGQRSFAVSGPSAWNDLPPTIHWDSSRIN